MALWQRPARIGLATFVVVFGIAVVIGIRDRTPPAVASGVVRADPEAVTQSRGARIVQQDASEENLRVSAERQLTYSDGSVRWIGNVDVFVPAREERLEFRLGGDEATMLKEAGSLHIVGDVRFESGDGLVGTTAEASYVDEEGIVVMPAPSEFWRTWMHASAGTARYDRRGDLLYLEPGAVVELSREGDDGEPQTRITSRAAVVAQREGYMRFEDEVVVDAGAQRMEAMEARTAFDADDARLETVELIGDAHVFGHDETPGQLRSMSAPEINVTYGAEAPEQVELANGARVKLFGDATAAGATIDSRSMEVRLTVAGTGFDVIRARDDVVVELPPGDGVRQRIASASLEVGTPEAMGGRVAATIDRDADLGPLLEARFDDGVEYRESRLDDGGVLTDERVIRARRLDATLDADFAGMHAANFIGSVELATGDITGQADQATYDVDEETFTLITVGAAGQNPRVDDRRGSIQAETIVVHFEGPDLEATGQMESVLTSAPADADGSAVLAVKRPQLLAEGPPIYVTAGRFGYDADLALATYSDTARLWQDATEFRGETLILDEATGNVTAEGAVRTRMIILQTDDETGEQIETTSRGQSESFFYDDALRRATYTTAAELIGDRFTLEADTIDVILHQDARTLDRIVAVGDVTLELESRRVIGETLTYYDADGRYEMSGDPVRIVEEVDEECRETTGRTMTFFITAEAVSIDGQSEVRTESTNGVCLDEVQDEEIQQADVP